jgi:hypothetical protein
MIFSESFTHIEGFIDFGFEKYLKKVLHSKPIKKLLLKYKGLTMGQIIFLELNLN